MNNNNLIIIILVLVIAVGGYLWHKDRNTASISIGDKTIEIEK